MRNVLSILLTWILCNAGASAQSHRRWTLIDDSTAAIPKQDIIDVVATRMLLDTLLYEERSENLLMIGIMKAKDKEIVTLKKQVEPVRAENLMLQNNLGVCQENLIGANEKLASKKAWATVGVTSTIIFGVAVLTTAAVAVLNSLP